MLVTICMNSIELKKSLQHSIDTIHDENILKALYTMVTEYVSGETVGAVGKQHLTRADILRRCIEAENDIKEGRVSTLDEIKTRIKNGFGRK